MENIKIDLDTELNKRIMQFVLKNGYGSVKFILMHPDTFKELCADVLANDKDNQINPSIADYNKYRGYTITRSADLPEYEFFIL
jgi:hypothetical protein